MVEEQLQVGKRLVQRGGVRVYSRVVEEPVEENIQLREEKVRVERRAVDRPLGTGEADRLRDQSVEMTETSEEAVVQKRARVREEVIVGKETTQRTEKIRDTVRRTEVEVERLDEGDTAFAGDFRSDWETRYQNTYPEPYEYYQPAYDYGYRTAGDDRYRGKSWSDVEDELRTDYTRSYPDGAWERMKGAVRHGWEKVTGRR